MHPLLRPPVDGKLVLRKKKSILRALRAEQTPRLPKRIAILGGSTTQELASLLELFLLDGGIEPELYQSPYGLFYEDALFGEELAAFSPELVWIHTSARNLGGFPAMTDSPAAVEQRLDAAFERFKTVWERLRERFNCPVIQNNFDLPCARPLGNRDGWDYRGRTRYVRRLNERFAAYADSRTDFYLNDLCWLSASFGLRQWSNPVYWNLYKYCCCPEAMPELARSAAAIIKAIYGKSKKGLVLDLDNTLWGGVVGESGPEGLELGPETASGQLYQEFQAYLLSLKERGVLLTVNSKNDLDNALAGLNHPSSLLRPGDFACIRANWQPKDRNFAEIAEELGLLPESLVLIDDNPAERAIVTARFPDVEAPALDAPEAYLAALDGSGLFEPAGLSSDDLRRGEMYRANAERARLRERFVDYGEYLRSLDMRAEIAPFAPVYLARIAQLTNKSNQFNLTTRRYTESELRRFAEDPDCLTLYGTLTDRFGDNGVVSVVLGRRAGDAVDIELWLMSCRVLKRNLEHAMLDELAARAVQSGASRLRGYYRETARNGMVRTLYRDFGFTLVGENGGDTVWELPLSGYEKRNRVIRVNGEEIGHGPQADF